MRRSRKTAESVEVRGSPQRSSDVFQRCSNRGHRDAAVSKAVRGHWPLEGSNPSPSAQSSGSWSGSRFGAGAAVPETAALSPWKVHGRLLKSTGYVRHWRTSGAPLRHRTFSSQPTPQAGEAVEGGEALGYSARLGRLPLGLTGDDDAFALPLDGPTCQKRSSRNSSVPGVNSR